MLDLSKEMLEKLKQAKTLEGLTTLAKENKIELTEEEAKEYLGQINPQL